MAQRVRVTDPTFTNRALSMNEVRRGMETLVIPGAVNGTARAGVFPGAAWPGPTTPTTSMSSTVPAFQCAIARSGEGVWLVNTAAAVTVDHPAPNSTNPRIDYIICRVYDTEAGDTFPADVAPSGTQTGIAVVEVVAGSPASSPTEPNLPVGSVLLRKVNVPAGAGATLTAGVYGRRGQRTATRGGLVIVQDKDEREALYKYPGLYVYQEDTDQFLMRGVDHWKLASTEQYGSNGSQPGSRLTNENFGSTSFMWVAGLGSNIVVPADGVRRDIRVTATCQVLGTGWMRLRMFTATQTVDWPNVDGKYTNSPSEETTTSIDGIATVPEGTGATIHLEVRSSTMYSASFRVPTVIAVAS